MYGAKTRVSWTQGDHTSKAFYSGPKTLLPALRKPSAHIGATSYATSWVLSAPKMLLERLQPAFRDSVFGFKETKEIVIFSPYGTATEQQYVCRLCCMCVYVF